MWLLLFIILIKNDGIIVMRWGQDFTKKKINIKKETMLMCVSKLDMLCCLF